MLAVRSAVVVCLVLAACDGNPFVGNPSVGVPPTDQIGSVSTLSGSPNPTSSGSITRTEVQDEGPAINGSAPEVPGNGYAQDYVYDADNDTFKIDNLAFDGGNTYTRNTDITNLGPARVSEAASTYDDAQTGQNIDQLSYRALYGVSDTGRTSYAIVRTGSYIPFGFGGFVYSRNGGVTLPTQGQARFNGAYAGLRDFDGAAGLQYTSGDVEVDIDFNDFNPNEGLGGKGVKGSVDNRKVFDLNGNDITASVLAGINLDYDASLTELPRILLKIGPGNMDLNGELEGQVGSAFVDNNGDLQGLESGKFYAVIAGPNAEEMVGVIVVTSDIDGVTARETGGFILYRP